MSTGGFVQHMVTAIKNNKRERKSFDNSFAGTKNGTLYNSDKSRTPNHTPEQIAVAKAAFQIKAAKENRKRKIVLLVSIIAAPLIGYLLFELMTYIIN